MPLLRTYKRFDETTFFRYTVNWFSRKTEKGRSVFLEQCCITRTSSIKAKDRIVCNFLRHDFGNPVPVVFLLFRFMYPLGKKEIDALQVEKEKFMEKAG